MSFDLALLFIAAAFMIAGAVKGALGLGLPPVAMGLLVLAMPPVEAAALLVIPALLTNLWQMVVGHHLKGLLQRLWPLLLCSGVGTLWGSDWLTPEHARLGAVALGAILTLYALLGLASVPMALRPAQERWAGPIAGLLTGFVTAATGVASIPVVPYLQAIGLQKDALVQAMGLSFSLSALALSYNLANSGALNWGLGWPVLLALIAAFIGLWGGYCLRRRIDQRRFQRSFLVALLLLGLYLLTNAL